MSKRKVISLAEEFSKIEILENRHPEMSTEEKARSFAFLTDYRDGGIFIAQFSGKTEWERHSNGDEIVFSLGGEATLILLENGIETPNLLRKDEFMVVPQNIWHRFESPKGAKLMTVTPQPTDHQIERPE